MTTDNTNKDEVLKIYQPIFIVPGLSVQFSSKTLPVAKGEVAGRVIVAFDDGKRRKPRQIPIDFKALHSPWQAPGGLEANYDIAKVAINEAIQNSFGTRFWLVEIHHKGNVVTHKRPVPITA